MTGILWQEKEYKNLRVVNNPKCVLLTAFRKKAIKR